jgi:hypothetical protein
MNFASPLSRATEIVMSQEQRRRQFVVSRVEVRPMALLRLDAEEQVALFVSLANHQRIAPTPSRTSRLCPVRRTTIIVVSVARFWELNRSHI